MRLFIAVELPGEVKEILGEFRSKISGARWVAKDQMHLTLAFLGDVDEGTAEMLGESLSQIESPRFTLRFEGMGCFPDSRRPRVLWVGLAPEPRLVALASLVRPAVLSCGIPQEDRSFSPHITLARFRQPVGREVAAFLDRHRQVQFPPVPVHEFILFQSRLTPQGAIHTPLRRFPLI